MILPLSCNFSEDLLQLAYSMLANAYNLSKAVPLYRIFLSNGQAQTHL